LNLFEKLISCDILNQNSEIMKKLLFLLGIIIALGTTSCKKDYTCDCVTVDSSGTIPDQNFQNEFKDAKKKDAEAACNDLNMTIGTLTTTCTLK
jgi:hypothetical protein